MTAWLTIDNLVPREAQDPATSLGVTVRIADDLDRGSFRADLHYTDIDALDLVIAGLREARAKLLDLRATTATSVHDLGPDDEILLGGERLVITSVVFGTSEVFVHVFDPDLATVEDLRTQFYDPAACHTLTVEPGTKLHVLAPATSALRAVR